MYRLIAKQLIFCPKKTIALMVIEPNYLVAQRLEKLCCSVFLASVVSACGIPAYQPDTTAERAEPVIPLVEKIERLSPWAIPESALDQVDGRTELGLHDNPPNNIRLPKFPAVANDDIWTDIADKQIFANRITHPRVAAMLGRYANNQRYFDRILKNAELYMPYVVRRLKERKLPPELALLPFIESAYDPFVYSHSAAAGLWQFIPSTARHVGLKQNWWYDGRRDIVKSTAAALQYLEYLYDRFDHDWLLALAAYNGGEGRVARAIQKNSALGKSSDYWSLRLSPETQAYVPKFLALAHVVTNPEIYGLSFQTLTKRPNIDIVVLHRPIDLNHAADMAGIETELLYRLNPGLKQWATPPGGPFSLVLPLDVVEDFKNNIASAPESDWLPATLYIVKPGDTLGHIAANHHIPLASLIEINQLQSPLIRVGKNLKIPGTGTYKSGTLPPFAHGASTYQVRKGDTLWDIAKKYRVPLSLLIAWNELSTTDILQPGRKLKLYPRS
jgi:membrane-bound lytic murein transglycosylase D